MKKTVTIKGMMCPHCEAKIKTAMEALSQVESADVSHEAGTAILSLTEEVANDTLKAIVEENGFTYISAE